MDSINLESIFSHSKKLPTLPAIAMKIMEAVKKDEPSLVEISETISTDPSLSVEVLKLINSSFYSLPKKITSVAHAVNMLGISTVKNLALSFSLVKSFKNKDENRFDYSGFWKNSLACAVAAKLIAQKVNPTLADDAFFLGLLHDIGILAMVQGLPRQYDVVLREMELQGSVPGTIDIENKVLGFNHMQVGRYLIKSWGLSKTLYLPIGCHHTPEMLVPETSEIESFVKILHMANLYIDFFNSSDKKTSYGMIDYFKQAYGFSEMFKADQIGHQIEEQTLKICPLFDIAKLDDVSYYDMIESARDQLADVSMDLLSQVLQQKRQIELLKDKITRDSMTQLYNYQWFHEVLHQEKSRSERYGNPLSVILADIDDFKRINDHYGHLAGDAVIKKVAKTLKNDARTTDHVARYGGEEFGIILSETDIHGALNVAERLRQNIASARINFEDSNISVTMSFGVTSVPKGSKVSKEEIIERVDQVLYEAKKAGKNQCRGFFADQD